MKKSILTTLLLFGAQLSAAPLQVTTSFSILGDVTRQIGQDRVQVSEIIAPNQDAHAFALTPQHLRTIKQSKLILINGLEFEPADFRRAVETSKVPFVAVADHNIATLKSNEEHDEDEHEHHDMHEHEHEHEHHHGEADPHVWLDPQRMIQYAANVAAALSKADPAGKAVYARNLQNYQNKIKELDKWAQQKLASIRPQNRTVLTAHQAFAYLGERYGLTFMAAQGISEAGEPSAKEIAALIVQIKQNNVNAIFTENIRNPRLIDQIARETGRKVSGKLYSDALSTSENTYLKMMQFNIEALSNALK